ncbi:MAG: hypothetical protein WD294_11830 [Phycisphaeraceae bacterium]
MAQAEPALLMHLFELDRKRMHLIALVLAIGDGRPSRQLIQLLAQSSARNVLDHTLAHRPAGLLRALDRLPAAVLSPEGYRHLIELLCEPNGAKVLRHACTIDEIDVCGLHALPNRLRRRPVLDALSWLDGTRGLVDALHLFADRGAAPSFEAVVDQFASAANPAELRAKVRRMVEALTLPDALPPVHVGPGRRLDQAAELRSLAKRWRSCLATYIGKVDQGDAAVYLWEESRFEAVCLVERRGRLGWFLRDIKGPRNSELDPWTLERMHIAFTEARLPLDCIANVIDHLIVDDDVAHGHQREEDELELSSTEAPNAITPS